MTRELLVIYFELYQFWLLKFLHLLLSFLSENCHIEHKKWSDLQSVCKYYLDFISQFVFPSIKVFLIDYRNCNIFSFQIIRQSAAVKWSKAALSLWAGNWTGQCSGTQLWSAPRPSFFSPSLFSPSFLPQQSKVTFQFEKREIVPLFNPTLFWFVMMELVGKRPKHATLTSSPSLVIYYGIILLCSQKNFPDFLIHHWSLLSTIKH